MSRVVGHNTADHNTYKRITFFMTVCNLAVSPFPAVLGLLHSHLSTCLQRTYLLGVNEALIVPVDDYAHPDRTSWHHKQKIVKPPPRSSMLEYKCLQHVPCRRACTAAFQKCSHNKLTLFSVRAVTIACARTGSSLKIGTHTCLVQVVVKAGVQHVLQGVSVLLCRRMSQAAVKSRIRDSISTAM